MIKRLAGETVLYGLGSMLPRFLNFLLVSVHTAVFSTAEYGVITKVYAYVAVINVIFTFGMETAYFRFATKQDGAGEKKVFDLAQTIVVLISLVISAIVVLFAKPISVLISVPGHENVVIMLALVMFIDAVSSIPFSRLRLQRKPVKFAIGKILNIALFIGLNLYYLFLSGAEKNPVYVFQANLIANAFYLLLFAKTFISWRPQFDRKLSPQMLTYAYPVLLTGLAGMTNEMFSRITLEKWLPENFYGNISKESALGIFGACYKLSVLMNLAILAFRYAAEPFFFSQSNEKNSPQTFSRVNHYFTIVCCVILLGVSINLDILKYFLQGEEYWSGLEIVPVLLLAYLFLGLYYNFSVWFKLTDKTYYGTIITLMGMTIIILANYLLIPVMGYMGSSLATLLCYFVMAMVCYWLGQKYYPIPYTMVKDFVYIGITTVLLYVVNSIDIVNQAAAITFHGVVMAVYLVAVVVFERKKFNRARA